MATKKNDNKKVTIKVGDAVRAYNIMTAQASENTPGFKISEVEKDDMFAILYASEALKPIANRYESFMKDVQERLKPENFKEIVDKSQKFDKLTDDEKIEVNKILTEYNMNVYECIETEKNSIKEVDDYPRISKDAFATLVKSNNKLDAGVFMLLKGILCKD